jgi:peptidoglycan hydrolase-like protein with peptidoglycan-binding domain
MRSIVAQKKRGALSAFGLTLLAASGLAAQGRIVLPEGSVILVRTTTPLQSATARTGQTFETVVIDEVRADNYSVIPAGSRIRGTMSYVQPATRNRSGVIEVNFDRLILSDGSEMAITGKLTSTDPEERRQIENDPNARVVLVGGRGVVGAGSERDPASTLLVALGNMIAGSSDVNIRSGTALAVQLEQPLVLRGRARTRPADGSIFTSADYVRAAQQALSRLNYYRGSVNGQLSLATQRALFDFQIDKGITATGNLDWRTARALGINIADTDTGGGVGGTPGMPSLDDIAAIRRNAQNVLGSVRESLGITALGRLSPSRSYSDADFELWFAVSSFADNVSLFEQLVRQSGNSQNTAVAARALASAARRVEGALQRTNASGTVRNGWSSLMTQMSNTGLVYR